MYNLLSKFLQNTPSWKIAILLIDIIFILFFIVKQFDSLQEGFSVGEKTKLPNTDVNGMHLNGNFFYYPHSGHILRLIPKNENEPINYSNGSPSNIDSVKEYILYNVDYS